MTKIKIATHSGSFHLDEVIGTSVLALLHPDSEIVRTRDPKQYADAQFVVDVGGVYDPKAGRFDHHQNEFHGKRENGIPYASAGLVWKEWGARLVDVVGAALTSKAKPEWSGEIVSEIDTQLMQYADAIDNGVEISDTGLFGLSGIVSQFNGTWIERDEAVRAHGNAGAEHLQAECFAAAMAFVTEVLVNVIKSKVAGRAAVEIVRQAERLEGGRVLLLANGGMPWARVVHDEMPELLFVVYPDSGNDQYQIKTVPLEPRSFASKKDLPAAWGGLRDADLAAVTGEPTAVFCHKNLFIAGAKTLEGALNLVRKALVE
jgi:uncharacterized UPF0160 family protein